MQNIMTKEREELIRKGGDLAVNVAKIMLLELDMELKKSNANAILGYQIKIQEKNDMIDEVRDGREKVLTLTQVVKELNVEGLTTTMFNKWLVSRDLGQYKRFNSEKRRTFQPNENFMEYIAEEGYGLTGHTADGKKVKVMYSWDMVARIEKLYKADIVIFIEENL